ncbi:bifunctional tRNA (5-methylaminomethyl-2-thiouridine)(34)-methyltransferase MnmD/FAD-dependent 5-carboxymethylaminomethyl-2-thiouridine(34) oxidoreductase MnmC [Trinickia fusca]|uniref:tRNA 5-methylaminomethyl-2-thiouridine biosynthesis bifunctional protein MnmC n=1 Tax=Trinickia fusca TaxID=2419777 RepID=A0A494X487_9BURK|nr:bifunctional tRNA (5-methylaminomethyl-2-thiouridine)(34)-methyltransferase MnmD/FAD-dependent 5-carboxymethylaminomethyl-2-thiouridine(34) oxidoreductase MnmC [Trinickia fusca]RKP45508.1 bifunctional tRNA (5-methylaminomethyl-2-thiouridine)(34)-methyltransferase MnmD/FAD-dependent 5-carboxymethylaminomethyl-2-thiouridine(34) oxidoreductase MnmC [Trinickia fusca]
MIAPLQPATLAFRDDGTPFSPAYDDVYHSAAGAFAQARHVFIEGNALLARWRDHRQFTILETGFGLGGNFLATWAAWREDVSRCERLHFVSIEKHPFHAQDLRVLYERIVADATIAPLAAQLADAWPMLVPGLHRLEFENGRVVLTIAFGDALELLPKLWLRADAFYLDGFSPAKNPDLWSEPVFKALARVAGDDATLATYTCAGHIRRGLEATGFVCTKTEGFAGKRTMLTGHFAPRWRVRRHEPPLPQPVADKHAIVIGAGMAGCALIERLAARGWRISVIERHTAFAREASGNPAGVFHPLLSRDDSVASRITRAGFLYALGRWGALEQAGLGFARTRSGLLHLAESDDEAHALTEAIATFGYPPEYARGVSAADAQALAQTALMRGGWFYPLGGALDPALLCTALCTMAGERLTWHFGRQAARLARHSDTWEVFDEAGEPIARAPVVIFANARDAARVAGLTHAPTRIVRGQLTRLPAQVAPHLAVPLIGDGYAVPLGENTGLLTGATYEVDDDDRSERAAGHAENLARLAVMLPAARETLASVDSASLSGRVAFRCVTSDRLPMIGSLADEAACARDAAALRGAWPLDLPRAEGLYGAFAFGSRGLVWSSLGAELVAAQIEGEPWPLERDLAESLDPARYLLRSLRQGQAG